MFDRAYDPCKSLLLFLHSAHYGFHRHGHATKNAYPSLMHVDVGEVDHTPLVHVPAVSVQSNAPSVDISKCGSLPPLTGVGNLLAWLDRNFWMQRRCRQLGKVQKPVTHRVPRISTKNVRVALFPALPPGDKRPSRSSLC